MANKVDSGNWQNRRTLLKRIRDTLATNKTKRKGKNLFELFFYFLFFCGEICRVLNSLAIVINRKVFTKILPYLIDKKVKITFLHATN